MMYVSVCLSLIQILIFWITNHHFHRHTFQDELEQIAPQIHKKLNSIIKQRFKFSDLQT